MFRKVLIANRGEIAVRVMRTCRELGIATVAVYSELDRDAMHVRAADEAFALGGQTAAESYLNTEQILRAIRESGADAVHPGYGFFSENTDFARAIASEGVTFIGPPPEAIEIMGDKISSRLAAAKAGVSGVPGQNDAIKSADQIIKFGEKFGWPVAIKAAYGGGGRGMKVVNTADQAQELMESAQREALAYFGRDEIYLERYLDHPRHIEMQVFADSRGNCIWLGERDCSSQRRHQKLIEESPAPDFPEKIRAAMGEAAVKVAKACGYLNAGTVEFLYQDGDFYFLEMNTRLQVEHPVTEMVTGFDLVEWQLRIASGEELPVKQKDVKTNGHAIEIRLNAEDPKDGKFLPSPGTIAEIKWPAGPGVRVDAGYDSGDTVSQYYDNLIAKLVVWGEDREHSRNRALRALRELTIEGVATTAPADKLILESTDFINATHSTNWVENALDFSAIAGKQAPKAEAPPPGKVQKDVDVEINGKRFHVRVFVPEGSDVQPKQSTRRPRSASSSESKSSSGVNTVTVPMQGTILKVNVSVGDKVEVGQTVAVLEAMKMENNINAEVSGTVTEVKAKAGDALGAGDAICNIE
jgi:acetyl-CoA/propionyl-CoA carboxylase biotin carboxyl carrier protein